MKILISTFGVRGDVQPYLALAVVTDSALRARAAALGEKIRAEDGMARAIEVIERHAAGFSQRARAELAN